jgi:trans-aconitate 2-methyltransferase
MTTWDPTQYLRFSDHRLRPAIDLVGRIDHPSPKRIADLGCGAGGPTMLLAERWPAASITAIDSSPDMLAHAPNHDHIDWVEGDIETWDPPSPQDVLFSNATIHWLDDHDRVFPRLMAHLAPDGVLAIQMPRNHAEPSHRRLAETARSPRWAERFEHLLREYPVHDPAEYHAILRPLATSLDVWETIYQQELTGENAVANWAKGSVVRPFLHALGDDAEDFFADYAERLRDDYPVQSDGVTLFPFRRLFIVATV